MRETSEPDDLQHFPGWRADWNISDLLRAASAGEPDEGPVQKAAPPSVNADWPETLNLALRVGERLRHNERRLAVLEASNRHLEADLARAVEVVSSRMKLLEALAARAEATQAAAEEDAQRAEARAAQAVSWLTRIADATRHHLAAASPILAQREPTGPVLPTKIAPQYASEPPAKARLRTCLEQYKANKAANANGGLKWIEPGGGYFSACNNRLKLEPA